MNDKVTKACVIITAAGVLFLVGYTIYKMVKKN